MSQIKRVAAAVDGSESSVRAARAAASMADALGVPLVLLHVFPMVIDDTSGALGLGPEVLEEARQRSARKAFDLVLSELSSRDDKPEEVALIGHVAEEIIEWLAEDANTMLVMGRRGQSRIGSLLLGSVSDKVLRHARSPVTVVS